MSQAMKGRSTTMAPTPDSNDPLMIQPSERFFEFDKLSPGIAEKISEAESKHVRLVGNEYGSTRKQSLVVEFADDNMKKPTQNLIVLGNTIVQTYSSCNAFDTLVLHPPKIVDPSDEVKDLTYLLVDLLQSKKAKIPLNIMKWMTQYCIPSSSKHNNDWKSSILKACCLCHRKRKLFKEERLFWAVLDVRNHFQLFVIDNGNLSLHMECDPAFIALSRSGKTVKLFDKSGEVLKRFIPIDPSQNALWGDILQPFGAQVIPPRLPLFFSSSAEQIPEIMLLALNEAILSDDMLVVKALIHFSVSKISAGTGLTEALFNIFTYAGKLNQLLDCLAASEFEVPDLKTDNVLRGNSQLSNMFKVFFNKYGKTYYDNFLKRIVLYIDSKGDLKLKTPVEADSQKAKIMVFTVLKRIAGSLEHVPIQLKHFAWILQNYASVRFNSKQATYSTLSGYFLLRFISKVISNPKDIDPEIQLQNRWDQVLIPAAQLLTMPFNLLEMSGKYEVFNSWNSKLKKKIYPKFINFVFSLAVIDKAPVYPPPSKDTLRDSLKVVFQTIGESKEQFSTKYKEYQTSRTFASPIGWNFAVFIASYFEQNNQ